MVWGVGWLAMVAHPLPQGWFQSVDFTEDAVSAVVIGVAQDEIVGGIAGVAGAIIEPLRVLPLKSMETSFVIAR